MKFRFEIEGRLRARYAVKTEELGTNVEARYLSLHITLALPFQHGAVYPVNHNLLNRSARLSFKI
jgi:hypothetical protein